MADTGPTSDDRTLRIYVGEANRLREQTKDMIRAVEDGTPIEDTGHTHVLNFASESELARRISPPNLTLLREIHQHESESIREAAEIVGCDFKQVHHNLTELTKLGVIELVNEDRSKHPIAQYDDIEVHYSSRTGVH